MKELTVEEIEFIKMSLRKAHQHLMFEAMSDGISILQSDAIECARIMNLGILKKLENELD